MANFTLLTSLMVLSLFKDYIHPTYDPLVILFMLSMRPESPAKTRTKNQKAQSPKKTEKARTVRTLPPADEGQLGLADDGDGLDGGAAPLRLGPLQPGHRVGAAAEQPQPHRGHGAAGRAQAARPRWPRPLDGHAQPLGRRVGRGAAGQPAGVPQLRAVADARTQRRALGLAAGKL